MSCVRKLAMASLPLWLVVACGDDASPSTEPIAAAGNPAGGPRGGTSGGGEPNIEDSSEGEGTAEPDAAAGGTGAETDAASGLCAAADEGTDSQPPQVAGSGLSGPIAELTGEQKEGFCSWLWTLPGYGDQYCCAGVRLPLRVAVREGESRESCLQDLSRFDDCPLVEIEAFEACAIDKLGRYCGTPPGCFAFGHGALTSTCLAE